MKQRKFNIVYETTNVINGMIYIGVHKTDNINDGYIGYGIKSESTAISISKRKSTSLFAKAVFEHGYKNFTRKVLYIFDNYEEAVLKEKEIVNEDFVKLESNYNILTGGKGGNTFDLQTDFNKTKIRESARERCLVNKNIKRGQFQNRTKEQRRLTQEKVNITVALMEKHFSKGLIRNDEQKLNNARSRSKFIYIDADGCEFQTAFEAGIKNKISHKVAELRSRRGNLGWSRRVKQ